LFGRTRGGFPDALAEIGQSLLDLRRVELGRAFPFAGCGDLAVGARHPFVSVAGRLAVRVGAFARRRGFALQARRPLSRRGHLLLEGAVLVVAHGPAQPGRQPGRDAQRRNSHDGGNEACDHGSVHERRPPPKLVDIHARQSHRALPA
jgi:hypothetical protein